MLTFHLITLFPESSASYLKTSIIGRALKKKKVKIKFYNPRDFVKPRGPSHYRQVDDRPYGGGPGMVIAAEPMLKAVSAAKRKTKNEKRKIIIFSPGGKQFTNQIAGKWAKRHRHIILICGRYEGIDARVKKILRAEEISIGPYVLTGGELPALVLLDAVARQLPGVLGKDESVEERRVASQEVYTRPAVLVYQGKEYRVPPVLLSGDYREVAGWRQQRQRKRQVDNLLDK